MVRVVENLTAVPPVIDSFVEKFEREAFLKYVQLVQGLKPHVIPQGLTFSE